MSKVIKQKNLPARLPVVTTLLSILCLDYWNAQGWVWGVILTALGLVWIAAFIGLIKQEEVDIFEKPNEVNGADTRSAWQKRMDEMQKK